MSSPPLEQDPTLQAQPEEPVPPQETPKDPTLETLEATRRAVEQAEAWSRLAATQALRANQPAPAQPEYPPPPEELDPALEAYIEGRIQSTLRDTTGQLYNAYRQDRQQDLAYRANLENERASRKFSRYQELEPEVRAYLSGLPLETQAAPGAYDEAYYAILGRKAEAEAQARAKAAPPLSGVARSPVAAGPPPLSPEEAQLAAELGITEKDIQVYGGKVVSINSIPQGA